MSKVTRAERAVLKSADLCRRLGGVFAEFLLAALFAGGVAMASSVPNRLDLYGSTSAELPSLDVIQLVGLEFSSSKLSVAGELSAAVPSMSILGISIRGEGQLFDFRTEFLGELLAVAADVDSTLELWPHSHLGVGLHGEVKWGPLLATYESRSSLAQGPQVSGSHRLQVEYRVDRLILSSEMRLAGSASGGGQASIAGEVNVWDIALGEGIGRLVIDIDSGIDIAAMPQESWKTWLSVDGTWRRLRVGSLTRLEASPARIGDQSFEVDLSDLQLPFLDSMARMPLVGSLGLDARVLPTMGAQLRASVETQLPGSDLGSDFVLSLDRDGLRNVSLLLEGEGMWTGEGGSVTASMRIDQPLWSRSSASNLSLHIAFAASSDPSGADLALEEARALQGNRLSAMADVRVGAAGSQLRIGGSLTFRTELLGEKED